MSRTRAFLLLVLLLLVLLGLLLIGGGLLLGRDSTGTPEGAAPVRDRTPVRLDVFFHVKEFETSHELLLLVELLDSLTDEVVLDTHVAFDGLHPEAEKYAACAARQGGAASLRFLACRVSQPSAVHDWAPCALDAGLDKVSLQRCVDDTEVAALASAGGDALLQFRVSETPSLLLGGKPIAKGATRSAVLEALCSHRPSASSWCERPTSWAQPGFPIVILTDSRCAGCRSGFWFRRMRVLFPKAEVSVLDVASPEGRSEYSALSPGLLPAILLDARAEEDPGFQRMRRELRRTEKGYQLSPTTIRPSFDPQL